MPAPRIPPAARSSAIPATARFCPHCSQRTDTARLSFADMTRDLLHTFVNIERGPLVFACSKRAWDGYTEKERSVIFAAATAERDHQRFEQLFGLAGVVGGEVADVDVERDAAAFDDRPRDRVLRDRFGRRRQRDGDRHGDDHDHRHK